MYLLHTRNSLASSSIGLNTGLREWRMAQIPRTFIAIAKTHMDASGAPGAPGVAACPNGSNNLCRFDFGAFSSSESMTS